MQLKEQIALLNQYKEVASAAAAAAGIAPTGGMSPAGSGGAGGASGLERASIERDWKVQEIERLQEEKRQLMDKVVY